MIDSSPSAPARRISSSNATAPTSADLTDPLWSGRRAVWRAAAASSSAPPTLADRRRRLPPPRAVVEERKGRGSWWRTASISTASSPDMNRPTSSADRSGSPGRISVVAGMGIAALVINHMAAVLSVSVGLLNLFRCRCSTAAHNSTRPGRRDAALGSRAGHQTGSAWR